MALSTYLTRGEWNACYFTGIRAIGEEMENGEDVKINLAQILIRGIKVLASHGYVFTGLIVDAAGNYTKVLQCDDDNTDARPSIRSYTFKAYDRAKEAVTFLEANVPTYDAKWLKDSIKFTDHMTKKIKELGELFGFKETKLGDKDIDDDPVGNA